LKTATGEHFVRRAEVADAEAVAKLLHDFNTEYGEPTPGPRVLAERVRILLGGGDTAILLGSAGPDGVAVLRFRPAIWTEALECYLAELYVVPDRRGQSLGRALMEAAIDLARGEGATHTDLGTGEDDVAARALYESLGFTNREGRPDGPLNYFYERELRVGERSDLPAPVPSQHLIRGRPASRRRRSSGSLVATAARWRRASSATLASTTSAVPVIPQSEPAARASPRSRSRTLSSPELTSRDRRACRAPSRQT